MFKYSNVSIFKCSNVHLVDVAHVHLHRRLDHVEHLLRCEHAVAEADGVDDVRSLNGRAAVLPDLSHFSLLDGKHHGIVCRLCSFFGAVLTNLS